MKANHCYDFFWMCLLTYYTQQVCRCFYILTDLEKLLPISLRITSSHAGLSIDILATWNIYHINCLYHITLLPSFLCHYWPRHFKLFDLFHIVLFLLYIHMHLCIHGPFCFLCSVCDEQLKHVNTLLFTLQARTKIVCRSKQNNY